MSYQDLGFDNLLSKKVDTKDISTLNVDQMITDGIISLGKTTLDRLLSNQNMESYNFDSGVAGWQIKGAGDAEFNDGTFRGSLVAGSIHIPDQNTTANSFHAQNDGDTFWGCTDDDFNTDNNNATAYILKTGEAKLKNIILSTNVVISDLQPGTVIDGQYLSSLSVTADAIDNLTITADKIANATITGTKIDSGTITGTNIDSATITATNITAGTITANEIASATITGSNIATGTITSTNITNGTITGTDIDTATITGGNIASGTITSNEIANATIIAGNIASGTITANEISSSAGIVGGQIDNLTITAGNIANLTITAAQIADITITGNKISPDTITGNKLKIGNQSWSHDIAFSSTDADTVSWASGTITMADGTTTYSITVGDTGNMTSRTYVYLDIAVSTTVLQVTTTAGLAVGDGKILIAVAENSTTEAGFQVYGGIGGIAIKGGDIENLSITSSQIAAGTITANEISSNTITASEILAGTITANEIATGTITASLIAAGTITGTEIAGTTITASNIAAGTITANEIAAGTITGTEIYGDTLSVIKADLGTIRAGEIIVETGPNTVEITPANSTVITAGPTGAPLFKVNQDGTVTATDIDIGHRQITVNVGDDIQTAIDTINTYGGGVVFLSNGTHSLTSDLTLYSNIYLRGQNAENCILDFQNNVAGIVIKGSNGYSTGTISVSNNSTTVTGSGTNWTSAMIGRYILIGGFWFPITAVASTTSLTIGLAFSNKDLTGANYSIADRIVDNKLENFIIKNSYSAGITAQYSNELFMKDIEIQTSAVGIKIDDSSNATLNALDFFANGVHLQLTRTHFAEVKGTGGIDSTTGAGAIFTECTAFALQNGSWQNSAGNGVSISDCDDFTANSITCNGNNSNGIELTSGNTNVIMNAIGCDSNDGDGIRMTKNNTECIIGNSILANNGGYGINIVD